MINFTALKNRQLLLLSFGLGLLFFGFNAAEQHFTAFYQESGIQNAAFQSLAILYASIILGNFLGPSLVKKVGIKSALVWGFGTYVLLVAGMLTKQAWLIYLLSFVLGVGCGIASIARVDFLRIISPVKNRGEYAGVSESIRVFGGFLGLVSLSFILRFLNMEQAFLLLGVAMALGILLMVFLKDIKEKAKEEEKNFALILRLCVSPKILLLLPLRVANGFILGLVLGAVPAVISRDFGIQNVGIIVALYHISGSAFHMHAGRLSDLRGRLIFLYAGPLLFIVAALLFQNLSGLWIIALVMVLLGIGSAVDSSPFSALMIDTFEKKVKEASAAIGNLSILLGIVPAFLLPQILPQNQLFGLAIGLSILAIISLAVFQLRYSGKS